MPTAPIINSSPPCLTGWTLHADPRLAELNFGDWEHLTYDEIPDRDHFYRCYDDPWHLAPQNDETLHQLDQRLIHLLHIIRLHPGQNIAAVSHGDPLRRLLAKYLHRDTAKFHTLRLPPGGRAILKLTEGDLRLTR